MKDYYDYEKTIRNSSKEINYLQQQIAALDGVSNKASQSKLASLRNQLAEAQEDFRDTQRDHEIELRSEGYDRLSEDVNKAFEKMTDDIKRNTDLQNQIIEDMLNKAQKSYGDVYEVINGTIKQHGLVFDDVTTNVISNLNQTATDLGNLGKSYGDVTEKAKQFAASLDITNVANILTQQIEKVTTANQKLKEALNTDVSNKGKSDVTEEKYVNTDTKAATKATTTAKKTTKSNSKKSSSKSKNSKAVVGTIISAVGSSKGLTATAPKPTTSVVLSDKEKAKRTAQENKELKQVAANFIKAAGRKGKSTTYKKGGYGEFNSALYKKNGYVLTADNRKQLAKLLGVTYDNDKKTGALYKKLKSIGYFAKGSKYIPQDLLGITQEKGQELVYKRADGTILTPLGKGDKVFTADMTDNLWKMAKMNSDMTTKNIQTTVNNKPTITLNFDSFMHVEGNVDQNAVQDLRKFKDEIISDFTKQLTNDFGMFGHKLKF